MVCRKLAVGVSLLALGFSGAAFAQDQAPQNQADDVGIQEIVVTAQKRREVLSDVPVSVTAATGEQLAKQGIVEVRDLVKIVPGFTYTESAFATPVFTLRGIGFYETSLGAKPTVTVYVDEVALPFSILTRGASLDLERVEVLKGPQGTLFGQSATGGAINYIAAKPTNQFHAGAELTYARFGQVDASGFVSGPLSDTLKARIAVKTQQGGAWQKSYTRNDELGDKRFTTARFLLDYDPNPGVHLELNVNGYVDKSDEMAAALLAITPLGNINQVPALALQPIAPHNNRAADWTPNPKPVRDHRFFQTSLRGDFELADDLKLTTITSYSDMNYNQKVDPDGTILRAFFYNTLADITAFGQEVRLSGKISDRLQFLVGGSYNREKVNQNDIQGPYPDSTSPYDFADSFGVAPWDSFNTFSNQKFRTAAVFGTVDYKLTDQFTAHAGIRYTSAKDKFVGCTLDYDGNLANGFNVLLNFLRPLNGLPANINIPRGGCVTTNGVTLTPGEVRSDLNQTNVSWRAGLDFKPSKDTLIYASVNKGYKAGSYPLISASDVNQFNPVTQESVLAYELGFKATVLDRTAQINGALFYYDYTNKQFRGRVVANPDIFGPLEALVNVPKSSVKGAELQLELAPTRGLRMTIGATYLDTKIRGSFVNYTSFGVVQDFGGEPFPLTPKYQITADSEYQWDVGPSLAAYVGGSYAFQSSTNGSFGQLPLFDIKDYMLVDLRAGLRGGDDARWTAGLFVRNLFDTYYYTNAARILDTTSRYPGMPRTYGVTVSYRL
ncbi:MAG: TonB-dependent receptor [Sphingomonadaceae bacterium]